MKIYLMIVLVIALLFVSACNQAVVDDTKDVISDTPIYNNNEQDPEDVKVEEKPVEKRYPLPVMDMTAEEKYKGESGGLYGNGLNIPPEAHWNAALSEASKIEPVDKDGVVSADGKIGFLVLGHENARLTADMIIRYAQENDDVNDKLMIINGAQSGKDAYQWYANPAISSEARLAAERAGLTTKQVQVIWIYFSNPQPIGDFPNDANKFQKYLYSMIPKLKSEYPNLRIVYISSEAYAGYSTSNAMSEPYAYEYAFAVKWFIKDQIGGNLELNYNPEIRQVKAPLMLWGPYLWTNGDNARSDGLKWLREDFQEDGITVTHSGTTKLAQIFMDFFKNSDTSKGWFLE